MKKFLFFALCLFVVVPAIAVQVCAKSELVTVVLDPSVGGTSYTPNNAAGVWKVVFPYGTVTGVSTCLASDSEKATAVGGETTGGRCYCKMTHPMASSWVFNDDYGTSCAGNCARNCGRGVQGYDSFRASLFGSVAP